MSFGTLQNEHAALMEEKRILDKKLGELAMQHNRELEEESQKHEATYKELQRNFAQLQEVQSEESTRSRLQDVMDELKNEHARTISALSDEHSSSLNNMMDMHSAQLQDIEAAAATRTNDLVAVREREQEVVIAALKAEHASAQNNTAAEKEQAHQAVIASLNAEHASKHEAAIAALHTEHTAIREAALAALRADLAAAQDAAVASNSALATESTPNKQPAREERYSVKPSEVPSAFTTPKNDGIPARGLSHVFVHLSDESGDEAAHMSETPLAYASEDDNSFSPTPAYPKDGKRAGGEAGARNQLRKDNASLSAQLQAAQDEIATLKRATSGTNHGLGLYTALRNQTSSFLEDYSTPARRDPASADDSQASGMGVCMDDSTMQLEGTLQSAMVQIEQLMELNDDFAAENQRWSERLRRNDRTLARSSPTPLRAVS